MKLRKKFNKGMDTDVYFVLHDGIFDYIGSIWRRLYTCKAV